MTFRENIGDHLFIANEQCRHVGQGNTYLGPDHPSSPARGHVITRDGNPGTLELRNEMDAESYSADWPAVSELSVAAMLGVVPELCAAPPGVVMPDLRPHYLLESS